MSTGEKARVFQMVLLGFFGFMIVAGVIAFATFRSGSEGELPEMTLWGTIPEQSVNDFLERIALDLDIELPITYSSYLEDEFDQALVEALAAGEGPDMIFLSQDLILRHHDKVRIIPYESYSERDFKDSFIEEGELFMTPLGVLGLPFSIDPMVLYWNRTLLSNSGIAQPPQFWDEFAGIVDDLTVRDLAGNITQSTISFGEARNVTHSRDLLAALILQAGGTIVDGPPSAPRATLTDPVGTSESAASAALRFYTEFANPAKNLYSWNRSLPESLNLFLAGDLALYPGFASELFVLREQNPNLNYDVTTFPQIRDSEEELTFGKMYVLAIMEQSPNLAPAVSVIGQLTSPGVLSVWEEETGLPPVRRDMLQRKQTDAFRQVFYDSALISEGYLIPDPIKAENIFIDMVEDVTSGRSTIDVSVRNADNLLERAL